MLKADCSRSGYSSFSCRQRSAGSVSAQRPVYGSYCWMLLLTSFLGNTHPYFPVSTCYLDGKLVCYCKGGCIDPRTLLFRCLDTIVVYPLPGRKQRMKCYSSLPPG